MNQDDKLKKFLDKNLQREFQKPVNEWSQIVEKLGPSIHSSSWWQRPWLALPVLVGLALVVSVVVTQKKIVDSQSAKEPLALVEFLIDSQ